MIWEHNGLTFKLQPLTPIEDFKFYNLFNVSKAIVYRKITISQDYTAY